MYRIIALIGIYIRFWVLPNPFSGMENELLLNIGAEFCLHPFTFFIVGLFYQRGSAPALGSFLYLIVYSVNIGLLLLWNVLGGGEIIAYLIAVPYLAVLVLLKIRYALGSIN